VPARPGPGCCRPGSTPLEGQLHRAYTAVPARRGTPLEKFAYLQGLRDRNTVLFYRLLSEHLDEMMPIVYTPTIGDAIQEFSLCSSRSRRLPRPSTRLRIEDSLRAITGRDPTTSTSLIVTDSEGILGIGDQGVGGVLICHGQEEPLHRRGGVDPDRMVPIVLDVGTDNLRLLNDDLYLGLRHARVRGERYDEFVDAFVSAAQAVFPHAMIHWEDFGASNAHRILTTGTAMRCAPSTTTCRARPPSVAPGRRLAAVRAKGERLSRSAHRHARRRDRGRRRRRPAGRPHGQRRA
jgi:malate dehydrogenase (oxaloacetate-decarboxylating)